jgi:mannose-6-phosphate isomerase-like protein (cupin superfamily)
MLIKKDEARRKENSPWTIVWEYDTKSKELWFAIAHINGRHPETGKFMNHICDEMYYVLSGEWIVHDEKWEYAIAQWDCFLFEKGEKFRVEWKDLKVALPTGPARSLDQYEEIND